MQNGCVGSKDGGERSASLTDSSAGKRPACLTQARIAGVFGVRNYEALAARHAGEVEAAVQEGVTQELLGCFCLLY